MIWNNIIIIGINKGNGIIGIIGIILELYWNNTIRRKEL